MARDWKTWKYGQWNTYWMPRVWGFKRDADDTGVFIHLLHGSTSAGVWQVDTSSNLDFEWSDLPGASTLEEAQALAIALWRMR